MPDTPRTPSEDQLVKDTRNAVTVALFVKRHWALASAIGCFMWGGAQWVRTRVLDDAQAKAASADSVIISKVDSLGEKVDQFGTKTDLMLDLLKAHMANSHETARGPDSP